MTALVMDRTGLREARSALAGRVAVVMTMGALHEGHAELVRVARRRADAVVVTVFLNPLQFAPGEDLDRYPKTLDADLEICRREGVDLVFAPTPDVVYPAGEPDVRVSAGPLGDVLEGTHRPGHFDGVLTVVAKLLHLTRPDIALFGEKDAQQLALIRHMVDSLDFPVEVIGVPTVREADGLAMSSRNTYLTDDDRVVALALHRALEAGAAQAAGGAPAVLAAALGVLDGEPGLGVDYLALVDDATWADVGESTTAARLLVAARVGTTRLIDNVSLALIPSARQEPTSAPPTSAPPTSAPSVG
ncbi:MAG: pantoate--beta-alanine ligase [Frankiales bacterium]|nr:pantoate--beta-alanine ligase [Frankiales bacterium]